MIRSLEPCYQQQRLDCGAFVATLLRKREIRVAVPGGIAIPAGLAAVLTPPRWLAAHPATPDPTASTTRVREPALDAGKRPATGFGISRGWFPLVTRYPIG